MDKKDDPEKQKRLFLEYSSELVNFIRQNYFSHLYDRTIFRDYYDKYDGFSLDDYSV
jgi:hypothetical protein